MTPTDEALCRELRELQASLEAHILHRALAERSATRITELGAEVERQIVTNQRMGAHLVQAEQERDELKHDIERAAATNAELATALEQARAAREGMVLVPRETLLEARSWVHTQRGFGTSASWEAEKTWRKLNEALAAAEKQS